MMRIDEATRDEATRPSCICCGPASVQQRCLPRYLTQKAGQDDTDGCTTNPIRVYCENKDCELPPQNFTCMMEFLRIIRASKSVPKMLYESDLFLKHAIPLYQLYRSGTTPSSDIYIPHCIGCSLSAAIEDGTKVSLKNVPRPLPLPQPATIHAESTSDNVIPPTDLIEPDEYDEECDNNNYVNENVVIDGMSALDWQQSNNTVELADDDSTNYEEDSRIGNDASYEEEDSYADDSYADGCPDDAGGPILPAKRKRKDRESRKESVATAAKAMNNIQPANKGGDHMNYLKKYYKADLAPPHFRKLKRDAIDVARKARMTGDVLGDDLVGAIVMPEFGCILPSSAMNERLHVDIHGMAKSPHDGTPPSAHMVLTEENVKELRAYMKEKNLQLKFFESNDFEKVVVDDVEMPENPDLKRSWRVDRLKLDQIVKVKESAADNGRVRIPPEVLATYRFMSTMRVRKDADMVMVTGDYCLEEKTDEMQLHTRQKLLCLRIQSLVTSSISDEVVESLYTNLLPRSGRKSRDVTRTSGSNGKVNSQSHKNFLYVLHTNDSLLPNKGGACLIIPHNKYYIVVYRKHNPKEGKAAIAITTYAPPQPGGAFTVHGNAIDYFPILGEFAYVKMMATLVLKRLNEKLDSSGMPMVAAGPIEHEMLNVEYARNVFEITGGSYRAFCKAFMSVNSMSLVAHPVGQHYDYFNKGGESLENKILFVVPSIKYSLGRGGSFIGRQFVFALLDWKYESLTHRRFYVTHADDMGMGPVQPRNAQQLLTEYFTTQPNGEQWRRQFDMFRMSRNR